MKRILFVVLFLIFVNGCASRANLEWNLSSWIGHDVDGLVQHWGTPSDISKLANGSSMYSWMFNEGLASTPISGTISARSKFCKITVATSIEDLVQSWQLEGNNCKA